MSHGYEGPDMDEQTEDRGALDTMSQFDEEQSEDDNEIELELTVEYMANGHSDMESKEFAAAEENFRSALELSEEHDFSKKLDYGPGDITLVLADCLSKQDKEEEALELLAPIADGSVTTHHSDVMSVRAGSVMDGGHDLITQLKACHTMGVIFLKRADTQAAEKRAQQAFKGRRKVCGPHDSATLESVQLLIDIYTAKNDKTKARAYRRFLDPSSKTKASTGGDNSLKGPAAPPVQPSVSQPVVAATLTSPFPTTPGRTDAVTVPSIIPAPLEKSWIRPCPPQAKHSGTASVSPRGSLSSTGPLARIVEAESVSTAQNMSRTELEHPTSQLSDSIRAAVQTASTSSTLPASPAVLAAKPLAAFPPASSPIEALRPVKVLQPAPTLASESDVVSVSEPLVKDSLSTSTGYPTPRATSTRKPVANVPDPISSSVKVQDSAYNIPLPVSPVKPKFPLMEIERAATVPTEESTTVSASDPPQISQSTTNAISPPTTTTSVKLPASETRSVSNTSSSAAGSLYASSSVKTSSSAASVPSPPRTKPSVSPRAESKPSKTSVHPLVTTAAPVLPPVNVSEQPSEALSATASPLDIVSPVDMSNFTDSNSLPAPVALPADHLVHPSRSTPTPPSVPLSASQAALASIFAGSGGKPSRKSSPLASTGSSTTLSSKNTDAVTTSALPVRQPSPPKKTPSPLLVVSAAPSSQATAEIPLTEEVPQQEEAPATSRTFSWLTDAKLAVPSSITRVISSQATASEAATAKSDASSVNLVPSGTTKRKSWSAPFSRSKTDGSTKKPADFPPPPPIPGSAASIYTASRNPSLTTLQSTVEPKRHMSLMASIGSQPLSFLNKELGFSTERLPRASASISRSHTSTSTTLSRTRQDLAPRFASIKTMRAEGKKSASIDAAMKLLREYDSEKKIMVVRESELKKNMKESHKGLASTGHGYAPIHLFCDRKTEAAVEIELLIEQGVDVNAVACKAGMPGHEPFTPLQRAIEHGHAEIVRLLVDADVAIAPPRPQKGTPNLPVETINHPLLLACTKGHTEITSLLLNAGAARVVKEFPHRQWHGNSLLHEACWLADTTMVKMLLDYLKTVKSQYHSSSGPDFESGVIGAPGQQDRFGATPIMYAIDLRDCTSHRMRTQKSAKRKDCLRLLLEHDIHGDLHSQQYRDNIARVLSTKWTRGPGKGHSIFCYCDEAGDEELTHLLDPFRYQVSPGMRCHATPQCTALSGSSIRSGSVKSASTDRQQAKLPEFPELMSAPVNWAASPTGAGGHFELSDGHGVTGRHEAGFGSPSVKGRSGASVGDGEVPRSPVTMRSHGDRNGNVNANGFVGGLSELASETSQRSRE